MRSCEVDGIVAGVVDRGACFGIEDDVRSHAVLPVILVREQIAVLDRVGILLAVDLDDEAVFLFVSGDHVKLIVKRAVPVDREVLQRGPGGAVQHKGTDAAVEHEHRAAAVNGDVLAIQQRKGNSFQAVVVIGYRSMHFHGILGIEIVPALGKDERDIALSLHGLDQPVQRISDIFARHDAMLGNVDLACLGTGNAEHEEAEA